MTFTATDECGNRARTQAEFRIVDTTPPTLTIPADTRLECRSNDNPSRTGEATASDVCGRTTVSSSDQFEPSGPFGRAFGGEIRRTWIARGSQRERETHLLFSHKGLFSLDDCSRRSTDVQTITRFGAADLLVSIFRLRKRAELQRGVGVVNVGPSDAFGVVIQIDMVLPQGTHI